MQRAQARRRAASAAGARSEGDSRAAGAGEPLDVTEAELQDFLRADEEPVEVDPVFRERLRARLWKLLRVSRQGHPGSSPASETGAPHRAAPRVRNRQAPGGD